MDLDQIERTFVFRTSRCDANGLWRLSSLLEAMQDTANEHCSLLHAGREELREKNLSWVLFKMEMQIDRYPCLGERITVRTYTNGTFFRFCPRYYAVQDENGNCICRAGSLWMLMDLTTRKTVSPQQAGIAMPKAPETETPIRIPTGSPELEGQGVCQLYRPQYTDVDVNGHVNNIRYADWLCNSLGIEILREKEIEALTIDYNYEVLPPDTVESSLIRREDQFQYYGCVNGKRMFNICGSLRPRKADHQT